jgi:uncharacterized membrane protein HdeD (DUF308 family)
MRFAIHSATTAEERREVIRLIKTLVRRWNAFSTWFNQKWVQIVYSVGTMALGTWMYLDDKIVTSLFGVFLIVAGLINIMAQFMSKESK